MESASYSKTSNDQQQQQQQQHEIEVPVAIPVGDDDGAGGDWSPSGAEQEQARLIQGTETTVLPTYDMIDSNNRAYGEQQTLQTATANAAVKTNKEFWQDQAGQQALRRVDQESEDIVKAANEDARRRDREGLEINQVYIPPKQVLEVVALGGRDTKKDPAAVETPKKGGGGYQVREYETKEYVTKEYQSNYEYKSICD